jgi:hypothetical protein
MAQIIQFRRDYSSNWTLANPVLAEGELGVEFDNYNVKIGNGISSWNQLPYGLGTASAVGGDWSTSSITGTNILISTGNTNTIYYPSYITTAALSNHTHDYASSDHSHTQYITTAAQSDHTHNQYVNTSLTSQWLTTAMVSENTSVFMYVSNSSLFGLTVNDSLSLGTNYTTHTHNYQSVGEYLTTAALSDHTHSQYQSTGNYLTTAALSNHTHSNLYVNTSASSLLQHTSATSAITSNAINTSLSASFQLTSDNSLSLGTNYTTHTHLYQSTGNYLTTAMQSDMSSVLQYTSNTSNITSNALNTSQSSLFQHTSATSNITSLGMNTSERNNYFYTSNNTFANSTHNHGGLTLNVTNLSTSITSASNGLTINISAANPGAGGGGIAIADSNSTVSTNTLYFSNSNNVSFGINGYTITASVPNNVGSLGFADSNGITFGVASTASNSSSVITGSVRTDYAGIGTTITTTTGTNLAMTLNSDGLNVAHPAWLTTATAGGGAAPNRNICEIIPGEYLTRVANISASQFSNRPIFNPFWLDGNGLVASTVRFIMSWATNTTPPVMTYGAALYSMNNTTQLTLINSTTHTVNYATSQSASYSGIRAWDVTGLTNSLSEGRYVLALYFSFGNTTNGNASLYGASNWPNIAGWILGDSSTAATNNTLHLYPFQGRYSNTATGFPNSVNYTQIYGGRSQDALDYYAILKEI